MSNSLTGGVRVRADNGKFYDIEATDFELAESGRRHLGDGEYQFERLYVANLWTDNVNIEVRFEVASRNGMVRAYVPTVVDATYIEDDLKEVTVDEDEDEDSD
ncbi:hypothetical protein LAG73_15935 [Pseudoxanthomonas japonensis]|nr:hypothetical protein LAG73_15935 [Pseudoxanthomonas japonensis]